MTHQIFSSLPYLFIAICKKPISYFKHRNLLKLVQPTFEGFVLVACALTL